MKLLRIDSSARHNSISRQLTQAFVTTWRNKHPDGEVAERDLASTTLPAITDAWTQAAFTEATKRTEAQQHALAPSERFISELQAAEVIVVGAPMYNFTISSPLKAWIDHIVRPGRTVAYGPDGPRGLLTGKKVVVLTARGGTYANGSPGGSRDFQEPYLRLILAFIGLTDITFIHAENQLRGEQAQQAAQEKAFEQIGRFIEETSTSSSQVHSRS